MSFVSQLRAFVGAIPRAQVRREAHRYLATASDCRTAQATTLRRILDLNAESRFSREHRFAEIRTPEEFRQRIGVTTYEDFRPWVEQVKSGRHDALLGPRNKLLMFSLSSGTTADSKYIPITDHFLKDYRRGWQIWGIRTLDQHPGCNCRTIVQISSNYDRVRTSGGTPCGSISGLVSAMQKRIVRSMYTIPTEVSRIDDPEARYYAILRLAIAEPEVGMVTTANPSTLIHLARLADQRRDELLRDIADGTLTSQIEVSAPLRKDLEKWTSRPRRERARQLAELASGSGTFLPRDYWPEMQVAAVWTGGSAAAYLPKLKELYGEVPVRDHGLSASEGRMTIPLSAGTSSGLLDVNSHYFEFIPESEYRSANPIVLQSHELEQGGRYYILLTTTSGFCRYDICDVVRCTGFFGTTPELEFLHKGAHIGNLTGEKLTEYQIVSAVRQVAESETVALDQFSVCPVWGDPPRYVLLLESPAADDFSAAARIAIATDDRLKSLNCEYREKRETARLAPLQIQFLSPGAFLRLQAERLRKSGGSQEQYKHPCLIPDLKFWDQFVQANRSAHTQDRQQSAFRTNEAFVPRQSQSA